MDHCKVQHNPEHLVRMRGILHSFDTQGNRFTGERLDRAEVSSGGRSGMGEKQTSLSKARRPKHVKAASHTCGTGTFRAGLTIKSCI